MSTREQGTGRSHGETSPSSVPWVVSSDALQARRAVRTPLGRALVPDRANLVVLFIVRVVHALVLASDGRRAAIRGGHCTPPSRMRRGERFETHGLLRDW